MTGLKPKTTTYKQTKNVTPNKQRNAVEGVAKFIDAGTGKKIVDGSNVFYSTQPLEARLYLLQYCITCP